MCGYSKANGKLGGIRLENVSIVSVQWVLKYQDDFEGFVTLSGWQKRANKKSKGTADSEKPPRWGEQSPSPQLSVTGRNSKNKKGFEG